MDAYLQNLSTEFGSLNMESELISIVVPVYKVEEYLKECICSILRQTYTNFELILVDDGSPDNCGKICDNYAALDKRIRVIHKTNGGLSDARNAGICIARGKYITFVDSDDYIASQYLERLYLFLIKYNADIVQCEYTSDNQQLSQKMKDEFFSYDKCKAMVEMLHFGRVQVNAWAKLYKASLFTNIKYPVGRINEDNLTTYKLINLSEKVICISDNLYYYRMNNEGIMLGRFSKDRYELLSFKKEFLSYMKDDAIKYIDLVNYSEMRFAMRLYNECIQRKMEKEFLKEQNNAYSIIANYNENNDICEMKYKVLIKLLKINRPLYKLFVLTLRK